MMKYFPLTSAVFEHQFGVRALADSDRLVEVTSRYDDEIAVKRGALDNDLSYFFQADSESLASQRDVVSLVSDASELISENRNRRTNESIEIDNASPLLSISRHVQEDLTILRDDAEKGFPLIAGCVCFPSGWCIGDKIGKSVIAVHAPVPEFEAVLFEPTRRLMNQLKSGRPVWRTNWGIRASDQLDQSPKHRSRLDELATLVTEQNAGVRCFFRVERQTLARLPSKGDILFAIHTHQQPLAGLDADEQRHLLGVLRTCPTETLQYKGILPMRQAITSFLESALR